VLILPSSIARSGRESVARLRLPPERPRSTLNELLKNHVTLDSTGCVVDGYLGQR
jgi:hypothetical protein